MRGVPADLQRAGQAGEAHAGVRGSQGGEAGPDAMGKVDVLLLVSKYFFSRVYHNNH